MEFFSDLGYRGDRMGALFDAIRSVINRLEALWEEIALSRNREFTGSLREADEDLRASRTASMDDLHAELEADDHHPLAL